MVDISWLHNLRSHSGYHSSGYVIWGSISLCDTVDHRLKLLQEAATYTNALAFGIQNLSWDTKQLLANLPAKDKGPSTSVLSLSQLLCRNPLKHQKREIGLSSEPSATQPPSLTSHSQGGRLPFRVAFSCQRRSSLY